MALINSEPVSLVQTKPPISLSVSVVCFNSSKDELQQLLNSLLKAIELLGQHYTLSATPVYLVDNSDQAPLSLDDFSAQQALLEQLNVELRHLHGHGNIGYGSAHNLVLEKLQSTVHLLLNPDLVLESDALLNGINLMEENPDIILVSPHATDQSGNKQYLCKRYPSVFTFLVRGLLPGPLKRLFHKRLSRFEMRDLSETSSSDDIPIVSGCFMLTNTAALKEVGGFDERYFLYFEDFDLSLRIAKLGKLAYAPTVRITHSGGHAARKGLAHLRMFARSGMRFFNTHGWRLFRQA